MASTIWDELIDRLDRAGIPADPHWRTLVLYMRNMREFFFLSEKQKEQMQKLIVDTLRAKDYSKERYMDIIKAKEEILLGPHKEKMQMALAETQELLDDVRDLLLRKKGDVMGLEIATVELVENEPNPQNIISSMRKAFREVVDSMERDMKNLTELSMTDQLTQLSNRRAFDQVLDQAISSSLAGGTPLSLVLIDIDHFKNFNDSYGHRIGDQALQVVGKTLLNIGSAINVDDAEEMYHPCRYGGEEFAVILPQNDLGAATEVAEEIRQRIESCKFTLHDKNGNMQHDGLQITVSLGVQQFDPTWNGAYVANIVEQADRKLYFAKETGRNRVCSELD